MNFAQRHIGPTPHQVAAMLETLGLKSLEQLSEQAIPTSIQLKRPLALPAPLSEAACTQRLRELSELNRIRRSFIGMGYYGCHTPAVIRRHILENPGFYTQYTPYQSEIAQGRLEALMIFQTLVADLTGLAIANASLLDEATAAAEAMMMAYVAARRKRSLFFVSESCHPQVRHVVRTRAATLGIAVVEGVPGEAPLSNPELFGLLLANPDTNGELHDFSELYAEARRSKVTTATCCDLLALTLMTPPGEQGADIAIGSAQRFGVPLGNGGPHAAFLACTQALQRHLPGRVVGASIDAEGKPAFRLALQTREQHIRRDRATSNICTAQVLLAIVSALYAVHHGPEGLMAIARRVRGLTSRLAEGLLKSGYSVRNRNAFDTLTVRVDASRRAELKAEAAEQGFALRWDRPNQVGISLDETTTEEELQSLLGVFRSASAPGRGSSTDGPKRTSLGDWAPSLERQAAPLQHSVFHRYHSEHELLRYIKRLEGRDLSLTRSMIPLGSCTMKLNAACELEPISWRGFAELHPFGPPEDSQGYERLCADLREWLCELSGMDAVSLQPNAGAQGEFAGLLAIVGYQQRSEGAKRDVCLIPSSAHGTNPASAALAGLTVVAVNCDELGNIDIPDLEAKIATHQDRLCALMLTYPSTHGVFEPSVRAVCELVHRGGGLVYLDGANMNAQVGLCRPGDYGADVCHLNLHKTFCIPHGGGGPGMGPICVKAQLAPFLPRHPLAEGAGIGAVSAAPNGSAGILPISWAYIALMGAAGLRRASQVALLNANYMAARLAPHYPVLFRGPGGWIAHEFILDLRPLRKTTGVEVDDIAKRLMDFGFHAPTMSFPVPGTLMIEPTESEAQDELDRFCDALIAIREEIGAIESGSMTLSEGPLRNAPHTAKAVTADAWQRAYSRQQAAFPAPWCSEGKFWPSVARVDNVRGDRNLVCRLSEPPTPGAEG